MPAVRPSAPIPAIRHLPQVSIVHSQPIVARGLMSALGDFPGIDVFLGDRDGAESLTPAVVICEESLVHSGKPGEGGAAVIVLSPAPREIEVQKAFEHGVMAYLSTGCRVEELHEAVRTAMNGKRFLCQTTARAVANGFNSESLTLRERDVLNLLARGQCNKLIASELDIAPGTVKAHLKSIMAKLNASSRTEAAIMAAARGLVSVSLENCGPRALPTRLGVRMKAPRLQHASHAGSLFKSS